MQRIFIQPDELSAPCPDERLLEIDQGLEELERDFPDKAAVVKLRFFAGLSNAETAALLGISTATSQRYWTFARAFGCSLNLKTRNRRMRSPGRGLAQFFRTY